MPSFTSASSTVISGASSGFANVGGGVGGSLALPSSTKASSRRGWMRASQPKRAAMEPNPPGAPFNGPVRIATYCVLAHRERDRRTQRRGRGIKRPGLAPIRSAVGIDVAIGLALEHQVPRGRQGAAVVRTGRRLLPGRALLQRIPGHQETLAGVGRRIAVRGRESGVLDRGRQRVPVLVVHVTAELRRHLDGRHVNQVGLRD